jgi:demethylmenaquinone methyltransferase/2-methoxy-6-polyprenyl-1,4-benzoquinol methylase
LKDPGLIEYYRARAAEYEHIYFRHQPERRAEIAAEVARLQGLVAGGKVLDLACGTGYWTEPMSLSASQIVAADIAPEMLAQARAKHYSCPVDFVMADLFHLPLRAGVFDFVTLGFWLSHHPRQDYAGLIARILYPLRRGGRIWMIDNNPSTESSRNPVVGSDDHGNSIIRRRLENGSEFTILKNYFTAEQLREALEPHLVMERLEYGRYYWSAVLRRP